MAAITDLSTASSVGATTDYFVANQNGTDRKVSVASLATEMTGNRLFVDATWTANSAAKRFTTIASAVAAASAGDTIFVDDPAWFLMFGSFAIFGTKVIGIPRLHDGPDVNKLAELAAIHKPKLYITNSVLHNPTSTSLSAAKAFQILKTAEQFNFLVVEDDVYCDLHPGSAVQSATRIATLDQLNRVIYLGGFSKTLAANLRVGFIATSPELAIRLADRKMLSTLTTTEISERVVYKILSEGHYRKHVDRIRVRLDSVRDGICKRIESLGMKVDYRTPAGMFLWTETGTDTNKLTEQALEQGYLLSPGSLFSPNQLPSTRMRINIASMSDPGVWDFLERAMR